MPARLRGTIIGKGVPGLIWSEDFVMRDGTGILFLDYRQPLHIWEWLFGLFRAGQFAGKPVEAVGWFRRRSVPGTQVDHRRWASGGIAMPSRPIRLGRRPLPRRRGSPGWRTLAGLMLASSWDLVESDRRFPIQLT